MTYPSVTRSYAPGVGTASNRGQVAAFEPRAPTSYDINYTLGKPWIDYATNAAYLLTSLSGNPVSATWLSLGNANGALNQLSDGTTTVLPTAGAIIIAGTASEITSTGTNSPGKITLSLPSAVTAPGSLATTTGLTAGTTFSATGGASTFVGTFHANVTGAAVTTIGTGGTGAVNIGNATGNTAVTGALTASTTLTATLGNITATNGNLSLAHAGNKLLIHATTAGSDSVGTATLASGTVTVATTAVSTNSKIFVSYETCASASGLLDAPASSISNGVHFVINSTDGADSTSTVNYWIVN